MKYILIDKDNEEVHGLLMGFSKDEVEKQIEHMLDNGDASSLDDLLVFNLDDAKPFERGGVTIKD